MKPPRRAVTMRDVGMRAGVSPITVSRALANRASVTAETREAVHSAAKELSYVPNFAASTLSKRGSKLVALLVPNVANSVFAETINGLTDVLEASGYALTIAHSGYSADREERLIRILLGYKPEAIVLTGFTHTTGARALLRGAGIPVVETWNIGPKPIDMAVGFSNLEAGRAMTRYLISKGHRQLGYHGGTQTDNDRTEAREQGFRQALAEAKLPADEAWIRSAPMELSSGAELAREVKAAPKPPGRPRAFFIASDIIASGFVLEAARIGLRIPQEVAITGFDDTEMGQAVTPPLTSVHVPQREIGQAAATLVLQRLRKERVAEPSRDLGFTIISRASA